VRRLHVGEDLPEGGLVHQDPVLVARLQPVSGLVETGADAVPVGQHVREVHDAGQGLVIRLGVEGSMVVGDGWHQYERQAPVVSQVDTGFEVQILDTHGKPNPGNHDCGGVIGTAAPSKNMAKPAGEWNRYIITCNGNQLTVVLNGEQIIDLELDKSAVKDRPPEGYIGFQDEGKPVWYRNVRIKEL